MNQKKTGRLQNKLSFVLFSVIFISVIFLSFCLNPRCSAIAADSDGILVTATYDDSRYVQKLPVIINISDTSNLKAVKYAYARVGNSRYFTQYPTNGFKVSKNSAGNYAFTVTQNGYVTVYAETKDGKNAFTVFRVTNIDTKAPTLEISSICIGAGESFEVTVKPQDDCSEDPVVYYVDGAYANEEDVAWENAASFTKEQKLRLPKGKYTFLVKDAAGNSYITIRKFWLSYEKEKEFNAVWIAYTAFSTKGYTESSFKKLIETMYNNVAAMNMNAVVVHVRPFSDAMYPSKYFPWSRYVSGTQGKDPGFDPLKIMIDEAHKRGLEFHAWLNPYRVSSSSTDVNDLAKNNPARIFRTDSNSANDRNVLTYDGKLYYNPASKEAQQLIVNGIKEIVENYNVDGIHFDDYFYPSLGKDYKTNFDAPEYEAYKKDKIAKKQSYLSIADWRRDNVNTLVKTIYSEIKKIKPNVVYGISPGGFMDSLRADDKYYVDFDTWLGHDGYIDYLCPQLYWSNDQKTYPFNGILTRFLDVVRNPDVKFYVGVGAYKAGITTEGPQWYQNPNVLSDMIKFSREKKVDGFVIYSYSYLMSKKDNVAIQNLLKEFR